MPENFTLIKDSGNIPVCAFQIGANALNQVLWAAVKVIDEVQVTDGSGFFQCAHYPLLDIDGDGAITAVDVLPRNNSTGAALYVGTAAADLDSNAGKFKLYADAGLTTPVVSTAVKCTYCFAAPISVDSLGRLSVNINSSALPTGAATEAKQDALIAKDFATQTTLAAILAKIIAAPATEAKQDVIAGYIDGIEALLTAVKDSDGIKKIADALPAGTNIIGKTGLVNAAGDRQAHIHASLGDEEDFTQSLSSSVFPLAFNGTYWERRRSNLQGTLLASQARTETQTTPDQTNYNGKGVHVILNVTAVSDTPSVTLKIEGKSASGVYYTLLEGAAVTGTGTHVYKVMPWATPAANEAAADLLPRTWRVVVTHADTDSITYSVDYAIDC